MKSIVLMSTLALSGLAAGVAHAAPENCLDPSWCPAPSADWNRDLLSTDLSLDLGALHGSAVITMVPSMTSTGASFDVSGLEVEGVSGPYGPLDYEIENGQLDVGVPLGTVFIVVDYRFAVQDERGWLADGVSFLWPDYCGNLYPCKPSPGDGQSFTLDVEGVPAGQVAVYPREIPWNAPSYQPALAVGDYVRRVLGTTASGTQVSAWYHPGEEARVEKGTAHLVEAFSFYEQTLGPYVFGREVGSVSTRSGVGYSGMEHHPLWHVSSFYFDDEDTHFHEAAHGWFGDGVRLGCWEDFVLSEGSATYWALRASEAVHGAAVSDAAWARLAAGATSYDALLRRFGIDTTVWPHTCNVIDLERSLVGGSLTYDKGALFLHAVEERVGRFAFDQALAIFYQWHVGNTATMQDLIDTVETMTGTKLDDLVLAWLRPRG